LVNAGYGSLNTVRQFRVFTNTGTVTLGIEPATTVDGVAVAQGNNGYDGTASQATATRTVLPQNLQVNFGNGLTNSPYTGTNYLIQYNSLANTVNQTNNSGNPTLIPLRFNGVAPDVNNDGILSGAYSFWTYEHIYVTKSPSNTNTTALAQYVANYIGNLTSAQMQTISGSVGYLSTKELNVFRTGDGTRIFRK
jgi:ABC-type phosphate transport system substrate-binding protein